MRLILLCFILIFFTACSKYSIEERLKLAEFLTLKNELVKNNIQTSLFLLRTYGRLNNKDDLLKVYIEGDGFAWVNKNTVSNDPTPINPIALKLALNDYSSNIIYIARPCQYNLKIDKNCNKDYWSKKRFSIEVIKSFNELLDGLKVKNKYKKFELIGFSGGGAIATLLASKRSDVIKITTIAGNLNHKLVNKIHNVSLMKESLNPIDIAEKISNIKQIHYIGEKDKIITREIVESYLISSKNIDNIKVVVIDDATHTKGWNKLILE